MTALAPALQAYFTERLITQRNSSPETIAAYRHAFRLLLRFAQEQTGKHPFELDIDDLDAPLIGAFLKHLEETGATAREPATPASGRSTPSTGSRRSSTPSTPTRSPG
jgi:site-specific recombinase XerC